MRDDEKRWKTYEEVATFLLNDIAEEFGLARVEGKQEVVGLRSGTHWTIDGKGVAADECVFFIVECRRYTTSKQSQERIGALAYRILDTGAAGGFVVSPLGLQEGAALVASAENIHNIRLDENSTTTEYILQFLDQVRIGVEDRVGLALTEHVEIMVKCATCNTILSRDPKGEFHCPVCGT